MTFQQLSLAEAHSGEMADNRRHCNGSDYYCLDHQTRTDGAELSLDVVVFCCIGHMQLFATP